MTQYCLRSFFNHNTHNHLLYLARRERLGKIFCQRLLDFRQNNISRIMARFDRRARLFIIYVVQWKTNTSRPRQASARAAHCVLRHASDTDVANANLTHLSCYTSCYTPVMFKIRENRTNSISVIQLTNRQTSSSAEVISVRGLTALLHNRRSDPNSA